MQSMKLGSKAKQARGKYAFVKGKLGVNSNLVKVRTICTEVWPPYFCALY